jgi:hypothetical protein
VPVRDPVLPLAVQPWHRLHTPLGVPHLDPLRVQPRLHPLADQPAGHRVDVARHPDRAARTHLDPQPPARLQAPRRQRPQQRHLLGQALPTPGVELAKHLPHERPIVVAAGEIPAAPEHQRLVEGPLELVVALLGVAVLVGLARLDRLALEPVVLQQTLVMSLEHLGLGPRRHGRRQPVGAVDLGRATHLPQGVLQPLTETLQALGKTERPGLPIRVRQHEVINQMRKGHASDGHPQGVAVREVAGAQPARLMDLGEEDLLGRAGKRPPLLDAPLQRSYLAVGEAAGVLPLQVFQQGLGLQPRVDRQQGFELGPDVGEGVGLGPPVMLHAYLTRQPSQPPVLTCRLVVHAGLDRSPPARMPREVEAAKAAHLVIRDHPKAPWGEGLRIAYESSPTGNSSCRCGAARSRRDGKSSCRRAGSIVVVHHKRMPKRSSENSVGRRGWPNRWLRV